MPSDFLVIRSLQVFASSDLTSARTYMEKRDTSFISEFNGSGATGQPKFYANWDENNIVVAPVPDQAYAVQLNYIITPPHFTSTNNTFLSYNTKRLCFYMVFWSRLLVILKAPWICTNCIKRGIMKAYRLLRYNKWVDVEELNTMMEYQDKKLHLHHRIQFYKEKNYGNSTSSSKFF